MRTGSEVFSGTGLPAWTSRMYRKVGQFIEAAELADYVHLLSPKKSEQGYATTDRKDTLELFGPHIRSLGKVVCCTVAIIWKNGTIHPHEDAIDPGIRRVAVVMQTNEHAWCMSAGDWQQLEQCGIYDFDPRQVHAAVNWGDQLRMHLIADLEGECLLTT